MKRPNGSGSITAAGYVSIFRGGQYRYQHVLVAEKAIGRKLPTGAVVHHVDGDRQNNAPTNLVVCQDQKYHALLHTRAEAFDACGNPAYRRCRVCREWDDPARLKPDGSRSYSHPRCRSASRREKYKVVAV